MCSEEKERNPQLGSVLVRRSAAHPLHAGVVGDVLAILSGARSSLLTHIAATGNVTLCTRMKN
jgi:hypothetical protein